MQAPHFFMRAATFILLFAATTILCHHHPANQKHRHQLTWIQSNPHATLDRLTDVTYGAGVYLIAGTRPTVLLSTDLKTWTTPPHALPPDARNCPGEWSAAYGPEAGFVLVSAGNPTLVSPDGESHTFTPKPFFFFFFFLHLANTVTSRSQTTTPHTLCFFFFSSSNGNDHSIRQDLEKLQTEIVQLQRPCLWERSVRGPFQWLCVHFSRWGHLASCLGLSPPPPIHFVYKDPEVHQMEDQFIIRQTPILHSLRNGFLS